MSIPTEQVSFIVSILNKPMIPMRRGLIPSSLQRKTSRSAAVKSLALLSRRAITKSTAQMDGQNVMKRLLSRCERSWASYMYREPEGSSPMHPDGEVNITEWPPSCLCCCPEVQRARELFDRELVVKFDCPGMFFMHLLQTIWQNI